MASVKHEKLSRWEKELENAVVVLPLIGWVMTLVLILGPIMA